MQTSVEKPLIWKPTKSSGIHAHSENGPVTIFIVKQAGLERIGLMHGDSYARGWYDSTEAAILAFEAGTVRWIKSDVGNGWSVGRSW